MRRLEDPDLMARISRAARGIANRVVDETFDKVYGPGEAPEDVRGPDDDPAALSHEESDRLAEFAVKWGPSLVVIVPGSTTCARCHGAFYTPVFVAASLGESLRGGPVKAAEIPGRFCGRCAGGEGA